MGSGQRAAVRQLWPSCLLQRQRITLWSHSAFDAHPSLCSSFNAHPQWSLHPGTFSLQPEDVAAALTRWEQGSAGLDGPETERYTRTVLANQDTSLRLLSW